MAALRWVRKNIHHFGGSRKRIALAGESAGGNVVLGAGIFTARHRSGLVPSPLALDRSSLFRTPTRQR